MSKEPLACADSAGAVDWVEVLRAEVQRTSQNKVAKRLGVSAAMLSQVLKGCYPASTQGLEQRVRGALMSEVVDCPVLGEIGRDWCEEWQQKPFAATNPIRVRVYRACRSGCPHSRLTSTSLGQR